jgi:hypothetical protein
MCDRIGPCRVKFLADRHAVRSLYELGQPSHASIDEFSQVAARLTIGVKDISGAIHKQRCLPISIRRVDQIMGPVDPRFHDKLRGEIVSLVGEAVKQVIAGGDSGSETVLDEPRPNPLLCRLRLVV